MHKAWQILGGLFLALLTLAVLLGVLSLTMVEGNMLAPAASSTVSQAPSQTATSPGRISATPVIATLTLTSIPTQAASLTAVPSKTAIVCVPPAGWISTIVLPGDTLDSLAARYAISSAMLSQSNCLASNDLQPGQQLYMPPPATILPPKPLPPTRTPVRCGAPTSWINYTVQPGDTLYHLGQVYGIPYTEIQKANCMSGTTLLIGAHIFVPPWATRTPSPTYPPLPTFFLPSDTPFENPVETLPAETSTPEPTATQSPTP
jgi:LysM repeat protein